MAHLDGSLSWQGCRLRASCSASTQSVPTAERTAQRSDLANAQPRKGGQFASSRLALERKRNHKEGDEILQEKGVRMVRWGQNWPKTNIK
jgi:hypothetical protein